MARTLNGNLTGKAAHRTTDDLNPGPCTLTERERLIVTRDVLAKAIRNAEHFPTQPETLDRWRAELAATQELIDNLPDPTIDAWSPAPPAGYDPDREKFCTETIATLESVRPY